MAFTLDQIDATLPFGESRSLGSGEGLKQDCAATSIGNVLNQNFPLA